MTKTGPYNIDIDLRSDIDENFISHSAAFTYKSFEFQKSVTGKIFKESIVNSHY